MTEDNFKRATKLKGAITLLKELIVVWRHKDPTDPTLNLTYWGVPEHLFQELKVRMKVHLGEKLTSLEDEFRKL